MRQRLLIRLSCFRKGSTPTSIWALGSVLVGLLVVGFAPADLRADTTLNSGTTTVSTGTNFGVNLYVATTGTATLNVIAGGYATNYDGDIGYEVGSVGTATVSSGTWANSGNLTVGLSGTGTLNISGSGLVTVGGTLSQGGNGTINLNSGGTLQVGTGTTGGVLATDLTNNGTLIFNRSDASTYSGIISGTGGVTKQGAGTLTFSGNNSYSGDTTISGGSLQIGAGGSLQVGTGGTTGSIIGDLTNNGTLIFNRSDASTYSGIISGTGAVTKQGAGTLTLTGMSIWPNAIVVDHVLNVQAGVLASLASGTGNLYVGNTGTGTLNVTGGSVTNVVGFLGYSGGSVGTATVSSGTWANSVDLLVGFFGTGTLNVTGGSVTNTGGYLGYNAGSEGTATVSGGTWANSGNLFVGIGGTGTLAVSGGSVTNTDGILGFDGISVGTATVSSGTWANSGNLTVGGNGTGTLNVTGGSVTNTDGYLGFNAFSFGYDLPSAGVGTATVSSGTWANNGDLYVGFSGTGTLNVSGGSVTNTGGYLGYNAGSVGTVTVSSGTWANSGNLTVGLSGTGTLIMNGGLVTVGGTLTKGTYGTINLNSGGTLQIGTGTTGGVLATDLTNNGMLIFNRSDAYTYSGIISGSGSVTKQGGGTLSFTGTSSYTGATHVDGGKMLVNGQLGNTAVSVASGGLLGGSGTIDGVLTVLAGGTLSPGNSPGILHVGSLQLDDFSTTLMEITGTAAGLYDQVVSANTIAYGGLLQLTISGSYAKDTIFELFQFTSVSGSFSSLTMAGSGPYAGLTFGAIGTGGYGADAWVSDWTTPTAPNGQRLVFFQNNGILVVIPEPSTYALLAIGAGIVGLMHRRKRRTATT